MNASDGECTATQTRAPDHLVITVHGIRTYGAWQDRLERLVSSDFVTVRSFKYGFFGLIGFMLPIVRRIPIVRFKRDLQRLLEERAWGRVDLVAHSFGTHLVAHALRTIQGARIPIHTVVLAGSALPVGFDWMPILSKFRCRIVNECGLRDMALLFGQLVFGAGAAGRFGFVGMLGARFRNRYYPVGHGGMFTDAFMTEHWVPLLKSEGDIPVPEVEGPRMWGPVLFVLKNLDRVKLLALALLVLAGFQGVGTWRQHEAEQSLARRLFETPDPLQRAILVAEYDRSTSDPELVQAAIGVASGPLPTISLHSERALAWAWAADRDPAPMVFFRSVDGHFSTVNVADGRVGSDFGPRDGVSSGLGWEPIVHPPWIVAFFFPRGLVWFNADPPADVSQKWPFAAAVDQRTGRSWLLKSTERSFSADVSDDGQRLLVVSTDRAVGIWNAQGAEEAVLRFSEPVHGAAFAPEKGIIVVATAPIGGDPSRDGTVRIVDVATGQDRFTIGASWFGPGENAQQHESIAVTENTRHRNAVLSLWRVPRKLVHLGLGRIA